MLSQAEMLVDSMPEQTLDILANIQRDSLTDYDLFMHCFLTAKAKRNMKEYERSDSIILPMLEYADKHPKSVNYPEVLLYAANYYRMKHEFSTALQFLEEALDELPENDDDLALRYSINVSYHSLLVQCGYDVDAYPYLLECIRICKLRNDSAGLYYRYLDLSGYHQSQGDFTKGRALVDSAFSFLPDMTPMDSADYRSELANIAHRTNRYGTARNYIHGVPEIAEKWNSPHTHSIEYLAAYIYARAGVYDSAYYYARKIIDANDPGHSPNALALLFNSSAKDYIPEDSVNYFWDRYQTEYNERQKKYEEVWNTDDEDFDSETIIELILVGLIILGPTLILAVIVLILVVINMRRKLKYQKALTTIEILKKQVGVAENPSAATIEDICEENLHGAQKAAEQRRAILERIRSVTEGSGPYEPSPIIAGSEILGTLNQRIKDGKAVAEDSPLWNDLKAVVLEAHPNFVTILNIITDSTLTTAELQIALMIKAGISPTGMAVLSGKEKGTISSRRNALGVKIFGQKLGVKAVDDLLRNA